MALSANGNVKNKEASLTCFSMFELDNDDYLSESNTEYQEESEMPNIKKEEEKEEIEENIGDKKQEILHLIKQIEPSLDNLKELLQAIGMTDIKMNFDDEKTVLQVSGLIHTDQGPKKIEKR